MISISGPSLYLSTTNYLSVELLLVCACLHPPRGSGACVTHSLPVLDMFVYGSEAKNLYVRKFHACFRLPPADCTTACRLYCASIVLPPADCTVHLLYYRLQIVLCICMGTIFFDLGNTWKETFSRAAELFFVAVS